MPLAVRPQTRQVASPRRKRRSPRASPVPHQTPPAAREFRPDLSPELIEVANRAMRKDPADRFASMRDFAKALTAFLNAPSRMETARKQSLEPQPSAPASPTFDQIEDPPLPTALPPRRRIHSKKKRKHWVPVGYGVIAATALVVAGALIGAFVVGNRSASKVAAIDLNPSRGGPPAQRNGGL
jgi:hypothetical protein